MMLCLFKYIINLLYINFSNILEKKIGTIDIGLIFCILQTSPFLYKGFALDTLNFSGNVHEFIRIL